MVAAGTTPPPVAAATDLLAAITAASGTVSPALTVRPSPRGRAVLAATSAVPGSRVALLQLPVGALLTPEAADNLLPPHAPSPLLDDYALLSLALIRLRSAPAAAAGGPVLAAYVAGLPRAADLDVPLLWGEAERARLDGSVLGAQAARMAAEVAAEFAAIDTAVLVADRDAFPADVYTAAAYAWSAAVVVERAVCLPDYPLVLAPGVDLATVVVPAAAAATATTGGGGDGGDGGGTAAAAAAGAVDIVGTGLFGRTKVVQLSTPSGGLPAGATVAGVTAQAEADGRSFRDWFLEAGLVAVPASGADDGDGGGVVGLSFGLSPDDGQVDDKLDILETYAYPGEAGGDDEDEDGERRVFPLAAAPASAGDDDGDGGGDGADAEADDNAAAADAWGRDSWTPPPDLMPFLRLVMLGGADVFLLEAVFRSEVWGFMALPVSEENEVAAIDAVLAACAEALGRYPAAAAAAAADSGGGGDGDGDGDGDGAARVRRAAIARRLVGVETAALRACAAYFERERETLDSKEYYQERRLRELNLLRPVDPSEIVDSESGGRAAAAFDEYY